MAPEKNYPSPAAEISKGYKRRKIHFEGEDSDSTANSVTKHDISKKKQEKATSRFVDDSDPFDIPKLLQELDTSPFGSLTKEIEELFSRRSQLPNYHRLHNTCLEVPKNHCKEPSKSVNQQVTHQAHQNVINLEPFNGGTAIAPTVGYKLLQELDTSPFGSLTKEIEKLFSRRSQLPNYHRLHDTCSKVPKNHCKERSKSVNQQVTDHQAHQNVINLEPFNGGTAIALTVIDLSSDDEESPQWIHSAPTIKDLSSDNEVRGQETRSPPTIIDLKSNDEDNGQGMHSHILQRVVSEPVGGLLMKDSMDCLKSMVGKVDIRIDEGGNVDAGDVLVEEGGNVDEGDILVEEGGNVDAGDVFVEEGGNVDAGDVLIEEGGNVDAGDVLVEEGGNVDAGDVLVDTEDDGLEDIQIKAPSKEVRNMAGENDITIDKGGYVGSGDDVMIEEDESQIYKKLEQNLQTDIEDDDVASLWKEMTFTLECSKDALVDPLSDEQVRGWEDCDHSFILKDDIGYVCRICGVIDRGIETIFEFQYNKVKKSTRTYMSDSQNAKVRRSSKMVGFKFSEDDVTISEISAHPRHTKQMKPHQVEGFNFLVRNLVGDNPGGCILAHAPGSGKTFMIISFVQSFLGKYPHARPLVVLPKGILATWKNEFQRWQVEDIPLYDFYAVKADNRSQQLEVLKQWVEHKSILFLGYKQFSTIICDDGTSTTSASCQEILLKAPSILVLGEWHTARNEDTDVLQSLAKVETPRKVVVSGTLYQNHVKEVFNILNLVRPKFLGLETSRAVVKRIMSRVDIPGVKRQFYDLVEHTLQKDKDFRRKVAVIQDLREMTSKVLHYYKGDFLDELPGLVDFTVVLNLSSKQKHEAEKLKKLVRTFKIRSVGSAVYLHPKLNSVPENHALADHIVDEMLENLDVKDGVKVKFFLNVLNLCESAGEKLLVFSQYLLPLKFLERLAVRMKGWSPGREIFVISGESSSQHREWSMDQFNNSSVAKVFFGSIKACGEGISLVGASRIIIIDVHLNPSVTRQAIGCAFQPGQTKRVFTYRLVAADSPEEVDHNTCFQKELISRMWFEWNQHCGYRDFEIKTVDVKVCGDLFLESPLLGEDIKVVYRR